MSPKWRPSLALVLGGALAGTLIMSFAGLVALRLLGPEIGFRNAAILLGATITLATFVLGWLLARLLLRPLLALSAYAEAQEAGGTPPPPDHYGTRELHATANRVISMATALRDREATIRSYTDHVTHEIRTPVAAICAAAELLGDSDEMTPEDRRLLAQIDGAARQIETQLTDLRTAALARETRHLGACSLVRLLPDLAQDWPGLGLTVEGEDLALPIAARGMAIVLSHLLRNAAEHAARNVTLRVWEDDFQVALNVSDDGLGISEGNAARIFEPFFSTRRESGGTGMGLVVVRNLLRAHGADIARLPSTSGACFQITFARGNL